MFGQPAAFARGNLFLGVFGDDIFVRLGEADRQEALAIPGAKLFAPMAGRPMREYVVLPGSLLSDSRRAADWVGRSLRFAGTLAPKGSGRPKKR